MSTDDIARLIAERDQAQSACQAWQDVYETIEAHIRDRIAMNDPADPEAYLRIIHACIAGVIADSRRICASRWADNSRLKAKADKAEAEAAMLAAALEFYATVKNWTDADQVNSQELFDTAMGADLGQRARAALAAYKAGAD